jgi:ABC-type multidrug transport system fused ATPase/permease subunit
VIILYILIMERVFKRMEADVLKGLREVVRLSDERFDQLVNQTAQSVARNELPALLVGATIGLLFSSPWELYQDFSWVVLYLTLVGCLMYALLGWVVYASIVGARLPAELYRQRLEIDIFDLKSFEPIGRQSLAVSLAFMGGIAISLVFSDVGEGIFTIQFWVVYLVLIIVAVLVFFLNMIPTHRVLSAAKSEELDAVMQNLHESYRELMQIKASGADTQASAAELNALKISQELVEDAKTWPYNIETLRNLLFTVLIPGAVALVRLLIQIYF